MRAVVQRVKQAQVSIDGVVVGEVGRGLLVLLCAMAGDTDFDLDWMVRKLVALRIFADAGGRMNDPLSSLPAFDERGVGNGMLVISQFTLSAHLTPRTAKGNRPAFTQAMEPALAALVVERFMEGVGAALAVSGHAVRSGRFGADMQVGLLNDGPVTVTLDTRDG